MKGMWRLTYTFPWVIKPYSLIPQQDKTLFYIKIIAFQPGEHWHNLTVIYQCFTSLSGLKVQVYFTSGQKFVLNVSTTLTLLQWYRSDIVYIGVCQYIMTSLLTLVTGETSTILTTPNVCMLFFLLKRMFNIKYSDTNLPLQGL